MGPYPLTLGSDWRARLVIRWTPLERRQLLLDCGRTHLVCCSQTLQKAHGHSLAHAHLLALMHILRSMQLSEVNIRLRIDALGLVLDHHLKCVRKIGVLQGLPTVGRVWQRRYEYVMADLFCGFLLDLGRPLITHYAHFRSEYEVMTLYSTPKCAEHGDVSDRAYAIYQTCTGRQIRL